MLSRRIVRMVPAVFAVALAVACDQNTRRAAGHANREAFRRLRRRRMVQIAPDLPPLPPGINASARPPEVTKAVYEFAARHPEVLKYMPCFCGCERMGHKGNDDCFVAGRDAQGKVTDWEYARHGLRGLHRRRPAGHADAQRRRVASRKFATAIDKRYDTDARSHTPTPKPPTKAAAPRNTDARAARLSDSWRARRHAAPARSSPPTPSRASSRHSTKASTSAWSPKTAPRRTLAANPHLRLMFGWPDERPAADVRPFDADRFVDEQARAELPSATVARRPRAGLPAAPPARRRHRDVGGSDGTRGSAADAGACASKP